MRALLATLLLLFAPGSAAAQALTAQDIVGLTKAGLGEEVLLALIEVHRPVFAVDPDTIKMLKDAGVRQNVIVAMVKSGREVPLPDPVVEPEPVTTQTAPPPVVIVEHDYPREQVTREVVVPVAVPVYVPVRVHRPRHIDRVEPVFWGFGGKLRPDAWTPTVTRDTRVRPVDSEQKLSVPPSQRLFVHPPQKK